MNSLIRFGRHARCTLLLILMLGGAALASGCASGVRVPVWEWGVHAGNATGLAAGYVISIDSAGDLYLAGNATAPTRFGNDSVAVRGGFTAYILHYRDARPDSVRLVAVIGPHTSPYSIRTDREGNVYVAGIFKGTVDFGGATLTASKSDWRSFVAKYRRDGTLAWVRGIMSEYGDHLTTLNLDASGDIYFATLTKGPVTIGDTTIDFQSRSILVRMEPDGNIRWIRPLSNGRHVLSIALTIDPDGDIIILGQTAAPIDLDGTAPKWSAKLPVESFLAAYAPDGERKWSTGLGRFESDSHSHICADADGIYVFPLHIYVRDSTGRVLPGRRDLHMVGFERDGAYCWSNVVASIVASTEGGGLFYGKGMGIDDDGRLYTLTLFSDPTTVGDSALHPAGRYHRDLLVTSHDAGNGALRWLCRGGGDGDDVPLGMTVSGKGEVFITGWFTNTTQYGPIKLAVTGERSDFFLVKLREGRVNDER
jgi:hypothetical protein